MPARPLPRPVRPFTNVQMDALLCLAEGLSTEEAAERCGVAVVTFQGWLRNIASLLPDDPLCPLTLPSRVRVERYAVALHWGSDRAA